MKWIIIPDVHADLSRLKRTMSAAGFRETGAGFRHPEGNKALFLGDLIDNGPENLAVVRAVRATVDDGEGLCLMGNHELNAILIHSGHRERSPKNLRQHEAFLREIPFGSAEAEDAIRWFLTLPLRADFSDFRAAHAYWGDEGGLAPLSRTEEHGALLTMLDPEVLRDLTPERGVTARAVLDVTKGPELSLPEGGYGFPDHYGHWRDKGRFRWWGGPDFTSWEEALVSLGEDARLPDDKPPARLSAQAYDPEAPLLFIGHYKMVGVSPQVARNVVCLDFPGEELFCEAEISTEITHSDPEEITPDFH